MNSRPPEDLHSTEAEDRWQAALAGKSTTLPLTDAETLPRVAGELVRKRHAAAVEAVSAEPRNDLLRARLLTQARKLPDLQPARRSSWQPAMAAGVAGIAAGVLATLMMIPGPGPAPTLAGPFSEVLLTEEQVLSADQVKDLAMTGPVQSYVIRSQDPRRTTSSLAELLALSDASFTLRRFADGMILVSVRPMEAVAPELAAGGTALGLVFEAGVTLRIQVVPG